MADSIETFIERLHRDGVQAGQTQSQQIIGDAKSQADKIIDDARHQAEKTLADADKHAKQLLENTNTELRLASRDCVLKLRQTISEILTRLLTVKTAEKMANPDCIADMIKQIVAASAAANAGDKGQLAFNVTPEMKAKLTAHALELAKSTDAKIDLRGEMKSAGFEYVTKNGTCEVTAQSIVDILCQMVNDELRVLIASQADGKSSS